MTTRPNPAFYTSEAFDALGDAGWEYRLVVVDPADHQELLEPGPVTGVRRDAVERRRAEIVERRGQRLLSRLASLV